MIVNILPRVVDISHFYITWEISEQFSRRDLKLMNHNMSDVGWPHTFQKLKSSCRSFGEAGSAITIDNDKWQK